MPRRFDYLLLGGGTSCGYAAAAIRSIDKNGTIAIVSADVEPPYDRPPFSKNFLTNDDMSISDAHSKDDSFYPQNHVELLLKTPVRKIDRSQDEVELASGEHIGYGKLLYALGSEPRLPDLPGNDAILLLRTASDSAAIRDAAKNATSAVIIGGGYIGAEVAAGLLTRGLRVTILEAGPRVYAKLSSEPVADAVQRELITMGADVRVGVKVTGISPGRPHVVHTSSGDVEGDMVIAGIGASPRIALAKEAGLKLSEHGVAGDETLRSSDEKIWLAGDVVEYPDPIMKKPFRAEHHLHAKWTGEHVGKGMAGEIGPYTHVPYFYSDVGPLSMIFRGDPDATGKTYRWGDESEPKMTEILVREDGSIANLIDLRRDYKEQDPINELAEKLIASRADVSPRANDMAAHDFDFLSLDPG
jgi:NADPH-dependent 2,4-dienoyl-CoA reductase/sulfur reductase-like enzyme